MFEPVGTVATVLIVGVGSGIGLWQGWVRRGRRGIPAPSPFSRTQVWYLLLTTLAGALVRLAYAHDRPLTFDEVGTLLSLRRGVFDILSHFDVWLSMNYYIVLEKGIAAWLGESSASLGLISLVSGVAATPLTALLARHVASVEAALVSASFIAVNPYLVRFSVIARSYALLMALSLATLLCFLRWLDHRTPMRAVLVSVLGLLMTLAHPNGTNTLAFLVFLLAVESRRRFGQPDWLRELRSIALGLGVTALWLLIAYARLSADGRHRGAFPFPRHADHEHRVSAVCLVRLFRLVGLGVDGVSVRRIARDRLA
jgi:Dolichyl-phosphate-mannose-protein mannosyltransferase